VTVIDVDLLIDTAFEAGCTVRTDYSGRYMYGETCVGVVGTPGALAAFVALITRRLDDQELDTDWLGRMRQDHMGLSDIWYWPGVTASKP